MIPHFDVSIQSYNSSGNGSFRLSIQVIYSTQIRGTRLVLVIICASRIERDLNCRREYIIYTNDELYAKFPDVKTVTYP